MELSTILALLQAVPGIFASAEAIKADLSETDLATLNATIASARASALTDEAKAVSDLNDAAKT